MIFLHGRDSTAIELASELFESQDSGGRTLLKSFPSLRWVFPTAGVRHAVRFGCEISQWFDMWSVENPGERTELQAAGLRESVESTIDLIQQETRNVPAERILLAGISQGCAVAIHSLLGTDHPLAGFIGLCGWLPFGDDIEMINTSGLAPTERLGQVRALVKSSPPSTAATPTQASLNTPIFLSHSRNDEMAPVQNRERLGIRLSMLGMSVEWHCYVEGGHWLNEPQGVEDMVAFINRYLGD